MIDFPMVHEFEGALTIHMVQADINAGYLILTRDRDGNATAWITPDGYLKTIGGLESFADEALAEEPS